MKRLLLNVLAAIALVTLLLTPPALADADTASGAKVFSANCAACHAGGNNLVNAAKTLKKSDLEKYSMASLDAIKTQVTNGKGAMPAFKGRLTDAQIEDIAAYVLEQADKGW